MTQSFFLNYKIFNFHFLNDSDWSKKYGTTPEIIILKVMKLLSVVFASLCALVFSAHIQHQCYIWDFMNAANRGELQVVRDLVEQGAVPANVQDGQALINAASYGHLEVVRYLVEGGPQASRVLANVQDG